MKERKAEKCEVEQSKMGDGWKMMTGKDDWKESKKGDKD